MQDRFRSGILANRNNRAILEWWFDLAFTTANPWKGTKCPGSRP